MSDKAIVIDTETDQGRNGRPIQVATICATTGQAWMGYFNSGRPISAVTTQVHGITDADVADKPRFELARLRLAPYLIGHNVRFDWRVIGKPKVKLICTVRLARLAFPEWQGYGLSRCMEQLLGPSAAAVWTQHAHDALADARMCHRLYLACCERLNLDPCQPDLVYVHLQAVRPVKTMPFGKYKGQPIHAVPPGYVRWMLNNIEDLSPSLKQALLKHLEQTSRPSDDILPPS